MSDRFCPSCGRLIGWDFISRPKPGGGVVRDLVRCSDLPRNADTGLGFTCAQMDALDAEEYARGP